MRSAPHHDSQPPRGGRFRSRAGLLGALETAALMQANEREGVGLKGVIFARGPLGPRRGAGSSQLIGSRTLFRAGSRRTTALASRDDEGSDGWHRPMECNYGYLALQLPPPGRALPVKSN